MRHNVVVCVLLLALVQAVIGVSFQQVANIPGNWTYYSAQGTQNGTALLVTLTSSKLPSSFTLQAFTSPTTSLAYKRIVLSKQSVNLKDASTRAAINAAFGADNSSIIWLDLSVSESPTFKIVLVQNASAKFESGSFRYGSAVLMEAAGGVASLTTTPDTLLFKASDLSRSLATVYLGGVDVGSNEFKSKVETYLFNVSFALSSIGYIEAELSLGSFFDIPLSCVYYRADQHSQAWHFFNRKDAITSMEIRAKFNPYTNLASFQLPSDVSLESCFSEPGGLPVMLQTTASSAFDNRFSDYLAPQGVFLIAQTAGSTRLRAGLDSLEYVQFDSTSSSLIMGDQNAFFAPGGTELTNYKKTAGVSVSTSSYFSHPQTDPFFDVSVSAQPFLYTFGTFKTRIDEPLAMPIMPYLCKAGGSFQDADVIEFDLAVASTNRKRATDTTPLNLGAIRNVFPANILTKSNVLATQDSSYNWLKVVFAKLKTEAGEVEMSVIKPAMELVSYLKSFSHVFVVATLPSQLFAPGGSVNLKLYIAGFELDMFPQGASGNASTPKFFMYKNYPHKSIVELLQNTDLWTLFPGVTMNDINDLRTEVNNILKDPNPWFANIKAILQDPEWKGLLCLFGKLQLLPDVIAGLIPGFGGHSPWLHHAYVSEAVSKYNNVVNATSFADLEGADFGGMIYFNQVVPDNNTAGTFHFLVKNFWVQFDHARIQRFSSQVRLYIPRFLDDTIVVNPSSKSHPPYIDVEGDFTRDSSGHVIFQFETLDEFLFSFNGTSFILNAVEIDKLKLVVKPVSVDPTTQTRALQTVFVLDGSIDFNTQKIEDITWDLLSFAKLSFTGLEISSNIFTYNETSGTIISGKVDFDMHVEKLVLSFGNNEPRGHSFFANWPFKLRKFVYNGGESVLNGYFVINVGDLDENKPLQITDGSGPKYALMFDTDFGSAGAIGKKLELISSILVAWNPYPDSEVYLGIQVQASSDKKSIDLFGVVKLSWQHFVLKQLSMPDSSTAFVLELQGLKVTFFGNTYPEDGSASLVFFVVETNNHINPKFGWFFLLGDEEQRNLGDVFSIPFLSVGQHLDLPKLSGYTIEDVIDSLKKLPTSPTLPQLPTLYDPNNEVIAGLTLEILDKAITLDVVFSDTNPRLYGAQLVLPVLHLDLSILYHELSDGEGCYDITVGIINFPISFGGFQVTPPTVHIEIYTGGYFYLGFGWPGKSLDFKHSFTVRFGVFTGAGGLFVSYTSAGASQLNPPPPSDVVVAGGGVALEVGYGPQINAGIFSCGAQVYFMGALEGYFGLKHGSVVSHPEWWHVGGQVGAGVKIWGSVNFIIVKASVYISASFVLDLEITTGKSTEVGFEVHVEVGVRIKLFWFVHIHLHFSANIHWHTTIGGGLPTQESYEMLGTTDVPQKRRFKYQQFTQCADPTLAKMVYNISKWGTQAFNRKTLVLLFVPQLSIKSSNFTTGQVSPRVGSSWVLLRNTTDFYKQYNPASATDVAQALVAWILLYQSKGNESTIMTWSDINQIRQMFQPPFDKNAPDLTYECIFDLLGTALFSFNVQEQLPQAVENVLEADIFPIFSDFDLLIDYGSGAESPVKDVLITEAYRQVLNKYIASEASYQEAGDLAEWFLVPEWYVSSNYTMRQAVALGTFKLLIGEGLNAIVSQSGPGASMTIAQWVQKYFVYADPSILQNVVGKMASLLHGGLQYPSPVNPDYNVPIYDLMGLQFDLKPINNSCVVFIKETKDHSNIGNFTILASNVTDKIATAKQIANYTSDVGVDSWVVNPRLFSMKPIVPGSLWQYPKQLQNIAKTTFATSVSNSTLIPLQVQFTFSVLVKVGVVPLPATARGVLLKIQGADPTSLGALQTVLENFPAAFTLAVHNPVTNQLDLTANIIGFDNNLNVIDYKFGSDARTIFHHVWQSSIGQTDHYMLLTSDIGKINSTVSLVLITKAASTVSPPGLWNGVLTSSPGPLVATVKGITTAKSYLDPGYVEVELPAPTYPVNPAETSIWEQFYHMVLATPGPANQYFSGYDGWLPLLPKTEPNTGALVYSHAFNLTDKFDSSLPSPYDIVGNTVYFSVTFRDGFGNELPSDALKTTMPPVRQYHNLVSAKCTYLDELVPLPSIPGVSLTYGVNPASPGTQLLVTLSFDSSKVTDKALLAESVEKLRNQLMDTHSVQLNLLASLQTFEADVITDVSSQLQVKLQVLEWLGEPGDLPSSTPVTFPLGLNQKNLYNLQAGFLKLIVTLTMSRGKDASYYTPNTSEKAKSVTNEVYPLVKTSDDLVKFATTMESAYNVRVLTNTGQLDANPHIYLMLTKTPSNADTIQRLPVSSYQPLQFAVPPLVNTLSKIPSPIHPGSYIERDGNVLAAELPHTFGIFQDPKIAAVGFESLYPLFSVVYSKVVANFTTIANTIAGRTTWLSQSGSYTNPDWSPTAASCVKQAQEEILKRELQEGTIGLGHYTNIAVLMPFNINYQYFSIGFYDTPALSGSIYEYFENNSTIGKFVQQSQVSLNPSGLNLTPQIMSFALSLNPTAMRTFSGSFVFVPEYISFSAKDIVTDVPSWQLRLKFVTSGTAKQFNINLGAVSAPVVARTVPDHAPYIAHSNTPPANPKTIAEGRKYAYNLNTKPIATHALQDTITTHLNINLLGNATLVVPSAPATQNPLVTALNTYSINAKAIFNPLLSNLALGNFDNTTLSTLGKWADSIDALTSLIIAHVGSTVSAPSTGGDFVFSTTYGLNSVQTGDGSLILKIESLPQTPMPFVWPNMVVNGANAPHDTFPTIAVGATAKYTKVMSSSEPRQMVFAPLDVLSYQSMYPIIVIQRNKEFLMDGVTPNPAFVTYGDPAYFSKAQRPVLDNTNSINAGYLAPDGSSFVTYMTALLKALGSDAGKQIDLSSTMLFDMTVYGEPSNTMGFDVTPNTVWIPLVKHVVVPYTDITDPQNNATTIVNAMSSSSTAWSSELQSNDVHMEINMYRQPIPGIDLQSIVPTASYKDIVVKKPSSNRVVIN